MFIKITTRDSNEIYLINILNNFLTRRAYPGRLLSFSRRRFSFKVDKLMRNQA